MSRIHSFITLSCLILTLANCSSQTLKKSEKPESGGIRKEVLPLTGPIQVHRYLYENGLKLLVIEDASSPTFAYQTWFKVGSRNEVPGRTGLAHLFEHMMFKGTTLHKEGEFDRILEGAGAEGENAFTSRDYTAYVEEMPKDQLELLISLEADRMVNLRIDDASFNTEREVVQNERRFRTENSPDGIMDQELFGLAFKKHPYHWPVIGYQKDLSAMSSSDALDFYHHYYSPNHATVIVVGDVKADQVSKLIQKHYGVIQRTPEEEHPIPKEPLQKQPRSKRLKLNIQVEKILIGYPIPDLLNPDSPVLEVVQSILTGGNSSRLHPALVDSGISSSVESYNLEDKDPSLLVITSNLQTKKKALAAESAILKEISQLSHTAISEEELSRAKNKLNFTFYQGLDSNRSKALFLGHYESITGDFSTGIIRQNQMNAVTAADVQRVIQKYLNPHARNVIIGVKK